MLQAILDTIPHRPPFLFLDRIDEVRVDGATCTRTFRADEPFYSGHYPGNPITPGVLLCESVFQAAGLLIAREAQAAGRKPGEGVPLLAKITEVRFRNPVYPGETVLIDVTKKEAMAGFTMMAGAIKKADGSRVLNVNFAVAWKTPEGGPAA